MSGGPSQDLTWPAIPIPLSALSIHLHRSFMQIWNVPASVYTKSERDGTAASLRLYNPVPNPISFKRKHFHLLKSRDYVVAEKTHGQRCVLLLTRDPEGNPVNVLVDRKCHFYSVNVLAHADLYKGLGTCFDGELVRGYAEPEEADGSKDKRRKKSKKKEEEEAQKRWFLVIFDTLMIGGTSYMLESSYLRRLELAKQVLGIGFDGTNGRALAKEGRLVLLPFESKTASHSFHLPRLHLRVKPVFSMDHPVEAIRRALGLDPSHHREWPTDGLIFTPVFMEVQKETHDKMIKVKELEANTIDFRLVVEKRPREKERLLEFRYKRHGKEEDICAGEGFPFIGYNLKVEVENTPALQAILARFRSDRSKAHHDTIVECQCKLKLDGEDQETLTLAVWHERPDKFSPNSMTTVYGTLETLHTGIGCKEILKYFEDEI